MESQRQQGGPGNNWLSKIECILGTWPSQNASRDQRHAWSSAKSNSTSSDTALSCSSSCVSEQRKQERLIRQARFKLAACVQDIDYQHPRNLKQAQVARLAQGDWINRGQNLLVTGPCGSGKTYLACALGHNACLHGYSVCYYRLSRLLLELTQAKADGSYHKQLKQLAKIRCTVFIEVGSFFVHNYTLNFIDYTA